MIDIIDKRGSGKTVKLMFMAAITRKPIVTFNKEHAELIMENAKKWFHLDVTAYGYHEFIEKRRGDKKLIENGILVDEGIYILSDVLGARIDAYTLTPAYMEKEQFEERYKS